MFQIKGKISGFATLKPFGLFDPKTCWQFFLSFFNENANSYFDGMIKHITGLNSAPGVVRTNFWTNPRTQVFWKNQFFSFCGTPKNFFWPKKPFLALETPTLGGSYLQKFLIWAAVLEISRADFAQKWLFWTYPASKPLLGSKRFRTMTPPKVWF